MDQRKLGRGLTIAGGALVAISLVWWLAFYSPLAREFKLPLSHAFQCLLFNSAGCSLVAGLASLGGYTPYTPTLMWLGLLLLAAAWYVRQHGKEAAQSEGAPPPSAGGAAGAGTAHARQKDGSPAGESVLQHAHARPELGASARTMRDASMAPALAATAPAPRPRSEIRVTMRRDGTVRSVALPEHRLRARGGMVLGRSSSCDLVVDDNTVSRQHARIWIDDQSRVLIEDMGSSNGTWCLEQRLGRAALGSRANVRLGDVGVLFEVERRVS